MPKAANFVPLNIAVLTISNRHTVDSDDSGRLLCDQLAQQGHRLHQYLIVAENLYLIRAHVSQLIADSTCQAIILSGGTGFAAKNCTPAAIKVLFDRSIDGFGELFRQLSYQAIEATPVLSAAMQSDAIAGLANNTVLFAIPGSPEAANLAASQLIWPQLDARTQPCNFANLINKQDCGAQTDLATAGTLSCRN